MQTKTDVALHIKLKDAYNKNLISYTVHLGSGDKKQTMKSSKNLLFLVRNSVGGVFL